MPLGQVLGVSQNLLRSFDVTSLVCLEEVRLAGPALRSKNDRTIERSSIVCLVDAARSEGINC